MGACAGGWGAVTWRFLCTHELTPPLSCILVPCYSWLTVMAHFLCTRWVDDAGACGA